MVVEPARASDVRQISAKLAPTAYCRGVLRRDSIRYSHDTAEVIESCNWTAMSLEFGPSQIRSQARRHAQYHPGHEVLIEQINRTVYWVDVPYSEQQTTVGDGLSVWIQEPGSLTQELREEP